MVGFDDPQGATALDKNEIKGLIPTHITTRDELDRWEQENINEALAWVDSHKIKNILNESFMMRLHKRLFGNVWKWAGTFRQSDKNIGISWFVSFDQLLSRRRGRGGPVDWVVSVGP